MIVPKRVLVVVLGGMLLAAVLVPVGASAQSAAASAVSGVELSSDEPGVLTIEWVAPSLAPEDYRVTWAPVGEPFRSWRDLSWNAFPESESHEVQGLVGGAEYKVRVRARYGVARTGSPQWSGPWSGEFTVRIMDDPPAAPTDLAASSVTHDSVTLAWTAPDSSEVTGYRVFRGSDSESRSVIADDTGGTDPTFTDSSVAAATEYVYSVLALSLDGDGAESAILTVTTPTDDTERTGSPEEPLGDIPVVTLDDENDDENEVEAIAVTFLEAPSEHDGNTNFEVLWDFSHEPEGLGIRSVVVEVLSVRGASIDRVWRREPGRNRLWAVRLSPDGYGDVTVTINGTANCADEHAVCDAQGLMLRGGEQVVLGPLTLSVSEPEVQEGPGAALDFVVSLNRAFGQAITVSYQTEDGTATAGSDYTATSGSLTFDAGQTEKTVSVPVLENLGDNGPEIVVFRLSSPSGAILSDEYAMGTIIDLAVSSQQEETLTAPSLSIADAVAQEGPGATLDFVVTLSHPSDQAITVTYKTLREKGRGAPRPEWDYHAVSGTLTFDAGQTEKTVSVRLREDEEEDGRENLTFVLTSSSGATIADAEATGTILNTPKGQRLRPRYKNHDRPDWTPGQVLPTSITSTEDHIIDVAWAAPISYTAVKFRINFDPVDPAFAETSFPWEGAETGNHWVHYPFATSTRLTDLTGGVEYKVRVQGRFPAVGQSPAWNGPWSRIMKVTVGGDGEPPPPLATASAVSSPVPDQYVTGQLTSLKLTTSEPGNILVEWIPASSPVNNDGPIPPDDYRVSWVKGDEPFPRYSDTASNADVAGVSYTLTALESGETYRVRVRANYPAGSLYLRPAWNGPWTELQIVVASPDPDPEETTTIVVIPAVIPQPVVAQVPAQFERGQLAAMRLASPEAGNIEASWTAPSMPTDETPSGYHVNWAKDQEPYPDSTASTGYVEETGASHTLTGLESGQTYRVRVRVQYPQGSNNAWTGPWTELEIVSATPEVTVTLTLVTNAPEELQTATQESVSTRALSSEAAAIPHDDLAFDTYIPRVWVVAQHNLVQLSWWRPAQVVDYRIWRAPAGGSAYTLLAEGTDVTSPAQPRGALKSRFYYTDTSVTAATSYKYAIQVLDVESNDYSMPYEALASTTEWIAPRTTSYSAPEPLSPNQDGDYPLEVGEKVKASIFTSTASSNFVLTLQEGEAYRVELYDLFAQEGGHNHDSLNSTPTFAGPVEPDANSANLAVQHVHGYHISLGSITQVASGQTIRYESSEFRPQIGGNWQVFWDGNLLKSWGDAGHLAYVFHAPAAGVYRVRVRTDFGPTQYGLKITRIPDQPNIPSFRQQHGLFTFGRFNWGHNASVLGNISVDDQDWFTVKLEAGKSYRVSLAAGGNLGWQGLSNPRFVAMAGPDGVQVQPSFEGSSRDRFRLNVPRDESGYYHLGVSGASASDRGLYVFSIVEADFPTNANAPVVNVGQQFIGMLESESDVDWIGAELTAGRTYRIQVSGSYGDIRGRLFARSISMGNAVHNKNGTRLSLGSSFTMETEADHNNNVLYLIDQIASARWAVANSGLYFFEIKKSNRIGRNYGAYYFQITDITP